MSEYLTLCVQNIVVKGYDFVKERSHYSTCKNSLIFTLYFQTKNYIITRRNESRSSVRRTANREIRYFY